MRNGYTTRKDEFERTIEEMDEFDKSRMERCRHFGDVTKNGIVFDYELVNADGAAFWLYVEPKHTDNDIANAKAHLMRERDVVGSIRIIRTGD